MSDVGSEKWKRKRRQREAAAKMREAKLMKISTSISTASTSADQPLSTAADNPEVSPSYVSDSENERPDYSSSDEEFEPQQIFDEWVTGLSLYDQKMLSVMLSVTLQKRFSIKATRAALESAWITGFNEKTIRNYRDEFFSNKGSFKDERRGKYQRLSLFNNESLYVDPRACC